MSSHYYVPCFSISYSSTSSIQENFWENNKFKFTQECQECFQEHMLTLQKLTRARSVTDNWGETKKIKYKSETIKYKLYFCPFLTNIYIKNSTISFFPLRDNFLPAHSETDDSIYLTELSFQENGTCLASPRICKLFCNIEQT